MIDIISIIKIYGLFGLFIVNFLSSSILPFPSEPAILFSTAMYGPYLTLIVSLAGTMLGGMTNYFVGSKGLRLLIFRREKNKEKKYKKWIEKYGLWSLLVVQWIPFVGDPLMVLMGVLKVDFKKFIILLFVGKLIKTIGVILIGEAILAFLI